MSTINRSNFATNVNKMNPVIKGPPVKKFGVTKRKGSSPSAEECKRPFMDITNGIEGVPKKTTVKNVHQVKSKVDSGITGFRRPVTRSSTNSTSLTNVPKKSQVGIIVKCDSQSTNEISKSSKNTSRTTAQNEIPSISKGAVKTALPKPTIKKSTTNSQISKTSVHKPDILSQLNSCKISASSTSSSVSNTAKARANNNSTKQITEKVTEIKHNNTRDDAKKLSGETTEIYSSSENLLYVSALENFEENDSTTRRRRQLHAPSLLNYDKELLSDPHQVSLYAADIFEYLKSREKHFAVKAYMHTQKNINPYMRAVLVDWMVEVQENFELNHETLYLAVKCVDIYLSKKLIDKEHLQLLGAAALMLSAKYDEQIAPLLEDFVHICDGAYGKSEFLKMEQYILLAVNFELGAPVSYSFLRRYARCIYLPMPQLTLARYILELSLMEYPAVFLSESKQAAAALHLSLKMTEKPGWNETLELCSGYKLNDFKDIVLMFNDMLHVERKDLSVIKTKYSHEVFFKVAKTPLLTNRQLELPDVS